MHPTISIFYLFLGNMKIVKISGQFNPQNKQIKKMGNDVELFWLISY